MKKFLLLLFSAAILPLSAVHIGFLMPSGARRGTAVEIIAGGQKFWGVDNVYVSGTGVRVEYVEAVRGVPNPDGRQRRYLSRWLHNIHKGDPRKPALPETTEGWRHHPWYNALHELSDCERDILYRFLFVPKNSLQASPAISGRVLVRLNIAPDAPVGERELRLISRGKISNPLKFFVGKHPEYREPFFVIPPAKPPVPEFTLPAVLNGQIMPGECDNFTFAAQKGEIITFSALGRYLMPFIGDGVPGHFQMILEVLDADGKSVAYADDRHFDPDPVLTFTVPADGKYTLAIRDALYRGREDFVYRITAFKGAPEPVKFNAPRIPGCRNVNAADLPGQTMLEPGMILRDTLKNAAGNIYKFRAAKGETLVLEVYARRQGSPVDAFMQISDEQGKVIAHNDDIPRLKAGLILHGAADPMIRFTAPADGTYSVKVADVTGKSGADHVCFLRISKPVNHFEVYAVASALSVNRNGWTPVTLIAQRYDGFDGEIKLGLRNGNITIAGINTIPAGVDRTQITVYAKNIVQEYPVPLIMTASGGGYTTKVIPGDEMMQAFAYTHIAPARDLVYSIQRRHPGREKFFWKNPASRLTLDQDATVTAMVVNLNNPPDAEAELVMVDPPAWLKSRPGKTHIALAGTLKSGRRIPPHPLSLTIYADPSGKGKVVNQIFKVVYKFKRQQKDGKIRVIVQETVLPAIRIEGGK